MKTNVYNLTSPRTGNAVPNQFVIIDGNKQYFKSYNTIIAKVCKGVVTLDRNNWNYSKTTIKYLCQFLGVFGVNDIRANIQAKTYKLTNLN